MAVAARAITDREQTYRSAPQNIEAEQALLGAILVNNEAFYRVSDFLEPTHFFEAVHRRIYQVAGELIRANKIANPVTIKTFLPGMLAKGWGRIINFAGMNAIHGYNGRAHVSASKHAAWGLTKALAKEFGAKGITTNIVSPGPIMGEAQDAAQAAHIKPMAARVPVGRLGTPDEVACVVALLASDAGAYINGQMIQVNGGAET